MPRTFHTRPNPSAVYQYLPLAPAKPLPGRTSQPSTSSSRPSTCSCSPPSTPPRGHRCGAKYTAKYFIEMPQIIHGVETGGNFAGFEMTCNEGVPHDQFLKSSSAFPCGHGVALHGLVGLLSLRALFDQGQQQPLGKHESSGQFHV